MTPPKLTLVSHAICPFVQRAAIVLAEKNIDFDRIVIDLGHKPDWFVKLSPLGKVPLLIVRTENGQETVLFESMAICEYIEEAFDGVPLYPVEPLARARMRGWIEVASSMLSDAWGMLNSSDGENARSKGDAFRAKVGLFEAELSGGPYFAGSDLSMVDAVVAPIFRYFEVLDQSVGEAYFAGFDKVSAWRRALHSRPSVMRAVADDFAEKFRARLKAQGSMFIG